MAPMKRERQWDMFDVVTGACQLDDYLNQRYSENDLQSKFWVEEKDEVDELRPPAAGTKEQVVIPIQGPKVGPPKPVAPVDSAPLPSRPSWETGGTAEPPLPSRPPWEAPAAPAAPPVGQNAPAYQPPAPPVARPQPRLEQEAPAAPPWSPPVQPAARPEPKAFPSPEPESVEPELPAAPAPPSMAELLAQFHKATQAYEERAKDDVSTDDTSSDG